MLWLRVYKLCACLRDCFRFDAECMNVLLTHFTLYWIKTLQTLCDKLFVTWNFVDCYTLKKLDILQITVNYLLGPLMDPLTPELITLNTLQTVLIAS